MRCKEESHVIKDIVNEALGQNDLIKLGIVLHAYADTFVHQGFSGILSLQIGPKMNIAGPQHFSIFLFAMRSSMVGEE